MKIQDFANMKRNNSKITMITCYDYVSAQIANASNIDCILVGDTSAVVMHGFSTTIPATVEMIATHVAAVTRGAPDKFIIGDLPFLSYRKGLSQSMEAIAQLMQAGAHAVKLEGAKGNLELVAHVVDSGVPVMGHLGLTPQSVHQIGGMRVQAREQEQAQELLQQARALQEAGCFSLVLECVPSPVAQQITQQLAIPTIGIGAGPYTSGQVLVWQDLLGMQPEFKPKFLKKYINGYELIKNALNEYSREVKTGIFPDLTVHSYINQLAEIE